MCQSGAVEPLLEACVGLSFALLARFSFRIHTSSPRYLSSFSCSLSVTTGQACHFGCNKQLESNIVTRAINIHFFTFLYSLQHSNELTRPHLHEMSLPSAMDTNEPSILHNGKSIDPITSKTSHS
jgi:hypothetical protein